MSTHPVTPPDFEPDLLLTSERWSELQVLQVMQENLTTFMGKLGPDEQKEYLRLGDEQITREKTLSDALNGFYTDLNQQLIDALENALKIKVGKPVNSRTTYLKTRIRQIPIPLSELPEFSPNDHLSKQFRIYKEDLNVQEYERSITLLEAAHRNFGFTEYFSTEEQRASYISDSAISVKAFVAVARSVDIGKRIADYIAKEFGNRLAIPLYGLHGTKLMIALTEAYRTKESWGISEREFNALKDDLFDDSVHWDMYQLDAGGEKIALPFYTKQLNTPEGPRVYSYFPDRPDGALRRHFSMHEAVESLQNQIRNEVGLKQFGWFVKAISLDNQEKIRTFIKPLTVNRDELYWHARILYDLFASKTPNRQKLVVEKWGVDIRSLAHRLPINQSWPIQSDLIRLARTRKLADREAAVSLLTYLVSETLSMLLIPVPVGVTGLSKVMLLATLGTLAYQTSEAVMALRRGQQAELVQAAGDIFDLLIGIRLQGAAGKLSARRTRKLMNALGNPNYGVTADGKPGLWFINAYNLDDPRTLDGLEQNSLGLFEKDNQTFIKLQVDGQSKVAKVILENGSGRYRLINAASNFQPYVTYSHKHDHWALDPFDTRPLSEAQLLQHMLSPSQLSLTPTACQRALDVAGIDRQDLLDVWFGRQATPPSLTQAIEDQHLRQGLGQLHAALKQTDLDMPDIADRVLPALLSDLGRCTINLYKSDGLTLLSRYSPVLAANEQPSLPIELLQDGSDRFRTRASNSPADSLLQHVLQEHERLNLDSTLGRTGRSNEDQHMANRLLELKKKLARHLDTYQDAVFHALQSDRPRKHLAHSTDAYRFAPTDKVDSTVNDDQEIGLLRRRFPDISRAMAADLLQRHPSLRDSTAHSSLEPSLRESITKYLEQSTITQALGALSDPGGLGLDAQSEALFCNLLTLLPGWPSDVGILVYQGIVDPGGRMIRRGPLLDIHGSEIADTFVMLVKSGNRYAGYHQDTGDLQSPPASENSLISATLRTLTDRQRDALSRGIYDMAGLTQDILRQARVHQDYLREFLIPSRDLPLSSQSLGAFNATNIHLSGTPDADGIYQSGNRKYVKIDNAAYQVMLDREASSLDRKVWRIVRSLDPVAMDDDNLYKGSRAGETQAISRNEANIWVATIVGAAGGMRRAGHDWSFHRRLAEQATAAANRLLRNPQQRVSKLFPSFSEGQITAFIQSLGPDVSGGLARRETEYATLKRALKEWTRANTQPSSSTASELPGGWAELVALEIRRCWRQETGTTLKLPTGSGTLPAVTADFSHVRKLELSSITWTGEADTFLANFSGLERLSITRSTLNKLPTMVGEMSNLTSLDLRSNRITLDDQSAARLSALSRLQDVDLSGNPLRMTPDFSAMSHLRTLNLRGTGINQWPTGLLNQASLEVIDLSSNHLQEIPAVNLNPPADQREAVTRINAITLLGGNEFPTGYLERLDIDLQRPHPVQPDSGQGSQAGAVINGTADVQRLRSLYPTKSVEEANTFIRTLGEGATAELDRLEQEHSTLHSQLDAWSFSGGGGRSHQYIRANQVQVNAATRDDRYTARDRILRCWRRETEQKRSADDGHPIGLELDLSGLTLPSLPDLDADFSHVGSLKLNNMNLSTSPEGFLTRYRHVRWLDLSNNQLRALPPALGEMHGLTRLALQQNQIRLTSETAQILSERTTLRAISLSGNPIGVTPDFSQVTDLRVLNMSGTGIDTWPQGLGTQPSLEFIQLSNNRITTIPDAVIAPPDERLAQTARVNNVTIASNNPFTDVTLERVATYAERLIEVGVTRIGRPNSLVTSALSVGNFLSRRNQPEAPFQRWATGLAPDQISARKTQWHALREQQGADAFFNMLGRLETLGAGQPDLQRRVWEVMDAITENNPESETLRDEIFNRAGEPTCCDRAAFSFGNLETRVMIYRARTQAMDQSQGLQLSKLSRGLLRLHEVDKLASIDIQRSETAINDPAVPEAEKRRHRYRLNEEVEIRLAYRHGLKDRLQLPGQPQRVAFTHMAGVTQTILDAAYEKVVALDNSPEEFQALISREFWQDYVTNKYRSQFEAQREPFQERLDALRDSFAAQELSEAAYKQQTDDQQAQLAIEEAALIQTLTRQELAEQPIAGPAHAND